MCCQKTTMGRNENKAKVILEYHKHPVIKIDISGMKFYYSDVSEKKDDLMHRNVNALIHVLRFQRVERRQTRSRGYYLYEKDLIQLSKVVGLSLDFNGFRTKLGTFLTPKEGLYLMEINRLELMWNGCPFSIQQAYQRLLKDYKDFDEYRLYRELQLMGVKMKKTYNKKRKLGFNDSKVSHKRFKPDSNLNDSEEELNENNSSAATEIENSEFVPDYKCYVVSPQEEVLSEIDLFCCDTTSQDYLKYAREHISTLLAFPFNDTLALNCVQEIDLPTL